MPKTPKQMIKYLKQNGFIKKSQSGSHVKMVNPNTNAQTIVPLHNKDLGKGLENEILKQAKLK